MTLLKQVTFLFLSLLIIPGDTIFANEANIKPGKDLKLTQTEQAWLQDHPEIRLSPDPDFLPIEFIDAKGKYMGIAADYIALIEQKLGIKFKILKYKNWDEVLEKSKARESDMWGAGTPTPQRLEYMLFTQPFIELPAVIIVRENIEKSLSLKDLEGLKVAVISGYGVHDHLSINHPSIDLDVVPDISTGLKKVSFGLVDAMIVNIALATYYIEKDGISNLLVAGESGYVYKWGFATRNDWPELNQILQKSIDQIDFKEKTEIYRKWVGLKSVPSLTFKDVLLPAITVLGLFAVIAIIISNRVLKKQVQKRTEDLQVELESHKATEEELENSYQLLNIIHQSQSNYILGKDLNYTFEYLLNNILSLTKSEYGFIGRVLYENGNVPYLKTHSITDISWDEESKKLYDNYSQVGFEFRNLDTLFGAVIKTGKFVIANDPKNDPRSGGLPKGHPPLNAFLGLPFYKGNQLIGMVGIANCPGGYETMLVDYLKPFLTTCSHIFTAVDLDQLRKTAEEEMTRAKEDAESANKAKTEFLSRMSHELRTPLNAVLGFGQLMEFDTDNSLSDTQKLNTKRILSAGNHLLNLVNDVLDLSRIESGVLEVKTEDFPLQMAIDEALMLIRPHAKKAGIKLTVIQPTDNNLCVHADKIRLVQVILNLLTNAIKYNKESGTVTLEWELMGAEKVRIHVKDTGMGIPKEMIKDIFEPFKRLDRDQIKVQGAGIGLSITKQLLDLMNGLITVESTLDEGSCFTIELPVGQNLHIEQETTGEMEHIKEPDEPIPSFNNEDFPKIKLSQESLSQIKEAVELNRISRVEIFANNLIQMGGNEEALGNQIKTKLEVFEMKDILTILNQLEHE